jgi:hypothetical protein
MYKLTTLMIGNLSPLRKEFSLYYVTTSDAVARGQKLRMNRFSRVFPDEVKKIWKSISIPFVFFRAFY